MTSKRHGPLSPSALAPRTGLHADYAPDQLELLADFLRRTADAGRDATDALVEDGRAAG